MTDHPIDMLDRAIAALTVSEYKVSGCSAEEAARDAALLFNRSCSHDLVRMSRAIGAQGPSLLTAIGGAIDEALIEIASAIAVLKENAAGHTSAKPNGARNSGTGNLKPAPDFLTGDVIGNVLDGTSGPGMSEVPIEQPTIAPEIKKAAAPEPKARRGRKPKEKPAPEPALKRPEEAPEEPVKPVSAPPKDSAPSNPAEKRQAEFRAAEMFLKRLGILVTVVDRAALVRRYRVSGKRNALFYEEVIELAIDKGWDANEAGL